MDILVIKINRTKSICLNLFLVITIAFMLPLAFKNETTLAVRFSACTEITFFIIICKLYTFNCDTGELTKPNFSQLAMFYFLLLLFPPTCLPYWMFNSFKALKSTDGPVLCSLETPIDGQVLDDSPLGLCPRLFMTTLSSGNVRTPSSSLSKSMKTSLNSATMSSLSCHSFWKRERKGWKKYYRESI